MTLGAVPEGLGVLGAPRILESFHPCPSTDGEPKLFLLPDASCDPPTTFCHSETGAGVEGDAKSCIPTKGLPFRDRGEAALLPLRLPDNLLRGVEDRGYRGGVLYCVFGVVGGASRGSSPSRARCDCVRSISSRLSFLKKRGNKDTTILKIDNTTSKWKNVLV